MNVGTDVATGAADPRSSSLALYDDRRPVLSKRADTALRVLLALATADRPRRVLTAEAIAIALDASRGALEPVLWELSRAGLVAGMRGPTGGYRLAAPLEDVTLADVVAAVDRPLAEACGLAGGLHGRSDDPLEQMWSEVRTGLGAVLSSWTVAAVLAGESSGLAGGATRSA